MEINDIQTQLIHTLNSKTKKEITLKNIFFNNKTLRLTKRGKTTMCKYYEHWSVDSPGVTAGNTLSLLRKMEWPYYIDKDMLILFTEKDSFMAKLAGSQGWLDGKE